MMLLLEVISDQQHLALVSSIGFHLDGYLSTWFETFTPGLIPSHPGGNLSTREVTFPPGLKRFHLVGNLSTWVETFPPGWKPSHPGGNLPTWLESFHPRYLLYTTSIYSMQRVFTLYNKCVVYAANTYSIQLFTYNAIIYKAVTIVFMTCEISS